MESDKDQEHDTSERRDFLSILAVSAAGVGAGAALWPVIDALNPARDVLALAQVEVDLSSVEVGQSITVKWRGRPVFIRRRTENEIEQAQAVAVADLPDPEADEERVQRPDWLIVVGVCTHLGCVPLGQKGGEVRGAYEGWFCPCHGSHYDTSGRIRRGPAARNLEIPSYAFVSETLLRIG